MFVRWIHIESLEKCIGELQARRYAPCCTPVTQTLIREERSGHQGLLLVLLVWSPGWLVEDDVDAILCDRELDFLNSESNLDIARG